MLKLSGLASMGPHNYLADKSIIGVEVPLTYQGMVIGRAVVKGLKDGMAEVECEVFPGSGLDPAPKDSWPAP